MKPLNKKQIIHINKYLLAAKQCCMIISLAIMYDQFEANDGQMQNAITLYKQETAKYKTWLPAEVKRARDDFQKVAKTYKGAQLNGDISKVGFRTDVNQMILNTEACCLYVMLRILRSFFKANYEQLDFFMDKYDEFNNAYAAGEQTSMRDLSHQLYEITGFDILKIEKGLIV